MTIAFGGEAVALGEEIDVGAHDAERDVASLLPEKCSDAPLVAIVPGG